MEQMRFDESESDTYDAGKSLQISLQVILTQTGFLPGTTPLEAEMVMARRSRRIRFEEDVYLEAFLYKPNVCVCLTVFTRSRIG